MSKESNNTVTDDGAPVKRSVSLERIKIPVAGNILANLKIRGRLVLGFSAVCAILVIGVATTILQVGSIKSEIVRIDSLRVPTALASGNMVKDIYASLAALRGWMIIGNDKFKVERAAVWADVDAQREAMDRLSRNWTSPDNVKRWSELKVVLDEFRAAQQRVEDIAHSADEQPATKILVEEAAPRAAVMIEAITRMIELEMAFVPDSVEKTRIVTTLRAALGYGGMIHQFKNFVLRQDTPRIAKAEAKIAAARAVIGRYRTFPMTPAEAQALADIEGVVEAYAKGLASAERIAGRGGSAQQIDQTVKVSDGPAVAGLVTLDREIASAVFGKPRVISVLRDALGYGGMIHQFKNFVLRQDKPRIAKVQAKIAAVKAAIAQYRTFQTTAAETQALADIAGVADAYAAALSRAEGLVAEGNTAEQIDKLIKIDDGPGLEGLATLDQEMAKQLADQALSAKLKSNTSADRLQLLATMADIRGSLGLGLANLRAFLLTGDARFSDRFKKFWAVNEKRWADLRIKTYLLTDEQLEAFNAFASERGEFSSLPAKMFEIRASKKWNMANYLLVTEAAPRAGKLLTALSGDLQADGTRAGGMVDNQTQLLSDGAAEAVSSAGTLLTIMWIVLVAGMAGSALVVFVTSRSIVDPVRDMTGAMGRLAEGDSSVEIPALDKTDEIGEMAQAVQVFKDNAIERERLEAEAMRAADERQERERLDREREKQEAEQEREREAEERRVKEAQAEERAEEQEKAAAEADARAKRTAELCATFDKAATTALETVSSASTEMQSTAQAMTGTAEQTTERATAVAAASEQTTSNVQTVAAAAEQLSNSIAEIGRQVSQSSGITKRAVEEASHTNSSVQGLAVAAQKIGDVVSLITDIAEQTNLLALNATIEAARAGDAGKGFAVVASEVKSLANQTAKATEEISGQISGMQGVTDGVVKAIEGISATIGEANGIATTIAAAVEEQGAATQEIARNVQQAANGTQEVSSNIGGVSQAASETGGAANDVLQAAGELSRQSETLRGEVDKFLADVRAA